MIEIAVELKNLNKQLNKVRKGFSAAFNEAFLDATKRAAEEMRKPKFQDKYKQYTLDTVESVREVINELSDVASEAGSEAGVYYVKNFSEMLGATLAEGTANAISGLEDISRRTLQNITRGNIDYVVNSLNKITDELDAEYKILDVNGRKIIKVFKSEGELALSLFDRWKLTWFDFYLNSDTGIRMGMRTIATSFKYIRSGIQKIFEFTRGYINRYGPIAMLMLGAYKAKEALDTLKQTLEDVNNAVLSLTARGNKSIQEYREGVISVAKEIVANNPTLAFTDVVETLNSAVEEGIDITDELWRTKLLPMATMIQDFFPEAKSDELVKRLEKLYQAGLSFDQINMILGNMVKLGGELREGFLSSATEFADKMSRADFGRRGLEGYLSLVAQLGTVFNRFMSSEETKRFIDIFLSEKPIPEGPLGNLVYRLRTDQITIEQFFENLNIMAQNARGDFANEIAEAFNLSLNSARAFTEHLAEMREEMERQQQTAKLFTELFGESFKTPQRVMELLSRLVNNFFINLWLPLLKGVSEGLRKTNRSFATLKDAFVSFFETATNRLGPKLQEFGEKLVTWLSDSKTVDLFIESLELLVKGLFMMAKTLPTVVYWLSQMFTLIAEHPFLTLFVGIPVAKAAISATARFSLKALSSFGLGLAEGLKGQIVKALASKAFTEGIAGAIQKASQGGATRAAGAFIGGGIASILKHILGFLKNFGGRLIGFLTPLLTGLGTFLVSNPIGWTVMALAAVGGLGYLIYKKFFADKEDEVNESVEMLKTTNRSAYEQIQELRREKDLSPQVVSQLAELVQQNRITNEQLQQLSGLSKQQLAAKVQELRTQALENNKRRTQAAAAGCNSVLAGFYYGGITEGSETAPPTAPTTATATTEAINIQVPGGP